MKDRLGIADWTAVVVNAAGGSVVSLVGRAIQVVALAVLALALWPTLGGIVRWLKFGAWVVPTPMSVSPDAARAVAASTDWVIVQDVLVWLAGHHVLWTGLPVAALVALVGQAFVSVGSSRRGRAGDIVSLSLRDEYVLRESWARWRPRLLALVAVAFVAALGALAWILFSK